MTILNRATIDTFNRALDSAQNELDWKYETLQLLRQDTNETEFIKMYVKNHFAITQLAYESISKEIDFPELSAKALELSEELKEVFHEFYWLEEDDFKIFLEIHYTSNSTDILGNINSARSGLL